MGLNKKGGELREIKNEGKEKWTQGRRT